MTARRFTSLSDPDLIRMLKDGAIGVLPTDTVYGLVGVAANESAIKKLYSVKKREWQPGTTIAASVSDLESIGFPRDALRRAEQYWPAPLSVEMSTEAIAEYLKVDKSVTSARIPDHPALLELLHQTGPLMTTSANHPGMPTAATIEAAIDYFGDEIDFYVDGGDLSGRPPSTIIGFDKDDNAIVYRQGAVVID